jgi:hypothetical protein
MLTKREQKVVNWLRKRKVATMRHLRHQFQLSHMTVVRALKKYGYYSSYNYNASYYVLHDVPRFDQWGLWGYRRVRFSRYGTLTHTMVALVESSPAGLTVGELEERLETKAANLVSRLVRDGAVRRETILGRQAVYLAGDPKTGRVQHQQRRQLLEQQAASRRAELPEGCSPAEVIEVLRRMLHAPEASPEQLARGLKGSRVHITAGKVRRVTDYYALEKKRRI